MGEAQQLDAPLRHRQNVSRLGRNDVVIAAYPGSGASLLGNIVLELGFDHIDPYTDVVDDDGSVEADPRYLTYRSRLAATAHRDDALAEGATPAAERRRFFKNHLYPEEFAAESLYGAVLLVRDPRDAVHSAYQYFRTFSGWLPGAPKVGQGSFADYLDGPSINGVPPVTGWARFYRNWLAAGPTFPRFALVHFEDLKTRAVDATIAMLADLDLPADPDRVAAAVERSSFQSMRAHEDAVSAREEIPDARQARLIRRGKVNEWREWFDNPDLAARFADAELVAAAGQLGYQLPGGGADR